MRNGKTIETYKQFVDYVFNSNLDQFVILNGKKSKTLCTIESANKEIKKLNNDIKFLLKENGNKEKVIKKQEEILNKAIEYMENYIEIEDAPINERIKIEFKKVLTILKGK